jgi:ABC-type Mn2+/Zn2+ transport system permease subunit
MIEAFIDLVNLFPNALISGIVMASVCSLVGVFVVLKRIVFISITLSETAACGIAAAMLFNLPPLLGAVALTAVVVGFLSIHFETSRIPRDAVLGVIFLAASALSILLVSNSGFGLQEIKVMLYGDLILAGPLDRNILLITGLPVFIFTLAFIRPIFYTFLDPEASRVMGISCRFWELAFFFLLGLIVSAASKSGGVLLVFCYLVAPPATALLLARSIAVVLFLAPIIGILATFGGLTLAYRADWPGNQTIIMVACMFLAAVWAIRKIIFWLKARHVG